MKTIRFTAYPDGATGGSQSIDGYRCDQQGDQSGIYVKPEAVAELLAALAKVALNTNHKTFTCAAGTYDEECPKCIAKAALKDSL